MADGNNTQRDSNDSNVSRRYFLQSVAVCGVGLLGWRAGLSGLAAVAGGAGPLGDYPSRGWERFYRNQFRYDDSFTFICAPNDTANCRLRGFLRNGVLVRIEQNYDTGKISDLYGNSATEVWSPRGCAKGYQMQRRVYSRHRLLTPLIRTGWKKWADDGFPSLTDNPSLRDTYRFNTRGEDTFERVSWDEAYRYHSRAVIAIAQTYSGDKGAARLKADGYEPEMIEACGGAGTRTMKLRGGMGLLGVMGKYGIYRWSNMLALLDQRIRGVKPDDALGGRMWSNYTWHGDQAPGMPFVHGLQASDIDLNDMRHSGLHISVGTNFVENKMPEAHFFIQLMERGGKIVMVLPEYAPGSTKADYSLHVRPGVTDTALFLGITRLMMDRGWYDEDFLRGYTDFPLLIRTDTLKRIRAHEVFPGYKLALPKDGPSYVIQNITDEQYEKIGDFVAIDDKTGKPRPLTRDDIGARMTKSGVSPRLSWTGTITLADGSEVEATTIWDAYKVNLRDYDLKTASEICGADAGLIERLASDIWETTKQGRAVAIHIGEGINHWFHATVANRSFYLPLMLTGQIGRPGSGCHTWAGNYKAALFQGAKGVGAGLAAYLLEDPFAPNLDPNADGSEMKIRKAAMDEEPAYWNHGERPLIVDTPKYGRMNFTGETHMPTPTKFLWFTNVNLFNNAKHAYDMFFNVNPKIDCIVAQDIEFNASCEYSDILLPALSWPEFRTHEMTASCSNPFLQIWRGGVRPVTNGRDDVVILAEAAESLAKETGDARFADHWRFVLDDKLEGVKTYIQRILDASITTRGYEVEDIISGAYGEPGAALLLFQTYPRIPFWDCVHQDIPFWTDTGRLNAYCDIPEAIMHGENFIVHREGPEATPYLPNVIISTNPLVRPDDFGIGPEAMHWDERTIRNIAMPWSEAKKTKNPLWEQGFHFYGLTPKGRHRVHSSWSAVEWTQIWESNFGDPHRRDKRSPGLGEHQLHINPEDAAALDLNTGDYVYVDANPADRPFRNWQNDPRRAKVARCMLRVTINPAWPRGVVMMKHAPWIATERSVLAHETRPDGLARSEDTGYQANLRYGSQQSLTRNWLMPMHQTDTLFHKAKGSMSFMFGGEADNHAVNTVPKECLVRIVKAEAGGLGGKGVWAPAASGFGPTGESEINLAYLSGGLTTVES
ncbi:MAG: nitrate oxidoreductase subunit alpha [Phycisphaeraceae bacterium]|nr:MAG: nitrate oxidoreductase subunit alpha [Phycisphaeraceae bacterium]